MHSTRVCVCARVRACAYMHTYVLRVRAKKTAAHCCATATLNLSSEDIIDDHTVRLVNLLPIELDVDSGYLTPVLVAEAF